jgi:hypothetical protein
MSAAGAERITLFGRRAGVRVFRLNPRGTLNSSERLLFKPDGNRSLLLRLVCGVQVCVYREAESICHA